MDAKRYLGQLRKMPTGTLGLLATRRVARRVATVNAYQFPSSMRQRLRLKHPDLETPSITLIEAATRQWFRLHARFPRARLSMPSRAVDDLWHDLLLHALSSKCIKRPYQAF
ncbi:MAG: hypothetical protein LC799_06045 [Actinobacteria bacterium]|nr:hypothetical protein [Actinomycetota bacterium]